MEQSDSPDLPAVKQIKPWKPVEVVTENPLLGNPLLNAGNLRFITIDRPPQPEGGTFLIARLIVPKGRENDSLFSSLPGQIRLLNHYFNMNRLILISNHPSGDTDSNLNYSRAEVDERALKDAKDGLDHLMSKFNPGDKIFESRFVSFDDGLLFRRYVVGLTGKEVGPFTVVDEFVRDSTESKKKSLRRRLRFETTANWLQTDICLCVKEGNREMNHQDLDLTKLLEYDTLTVDMDILLSMDHSASAAMLYGLALISQFSGSASNSNKALCLGVRGIIVPLFLESHLHFQVVGVEPDVTLMTSLHSFFGLPRTIKLLNQSLSEVIKVLGQQSTDLGVEWQQELLEDNFNFIMLDFNTFGPCTSSGMCVVAPPPSLATNEYFRVLKSRLNPHGALIMNVIAPNHQFYIDLVVNVKESFPRLYQTKVGLESEFVIVALKEITPDDFEFLPEDNVIKRTLKKRLPKYKFSKI